MNINLSKSTQIEVVQMIQLHPSILQFICSLLNEWNKKKNPILCETHLPNLKYCNTTLFWNTFEARIIIFLAVPDQNQTLSSHRSGLYFSFLCRISFLPDTFNSQWICCRLPGSCQVSLHVFVMQLWETLK